MRIERVYIATHKHDLRFTRICVASIRHWYPRVPIYLLKDRLNGDFSTRELERAYDVRVFETGSSAFGWGLAKLQPLFQEDPARFLVLDSDIVLLGKVIDRLEAVPGDFVVDEESQPMDKIEAIYFSLEKLRVLDPGFRYPGYTFNSGQFVARGGLLQKADFDALIDWSASPPCLTRPDVFKNGDQGIFNYVLMKKAASGRVTLARVPFMKWGEAQTRAIDLRRLGEDSPYPCLIHWAGLKKPLLRQMLRCDILAHFEGRFYSRVPFGVVKRVARAAGGVVNYAIVEVLRRTGRALKNASALRAAGARASDR